MVNKENKKVENGSNLFGHVYETKEGMYA